MTSPLVLTLLACAATLTAALPRSGRIVGGESTTIERYPWLVQVESLGVFSGTWSQSCGANILTSRYVMSAAHCFSGILYLPSYRRIRAGSTFRNTGGVISNVVREINHPEYGQDRANADINVVRLETPLVWSPVLQPSTIIAQNYQILDNQPVVHAGWGTTTQGGSPSSDLQHVTIYTINNDLCRERYRNLSPNYVVTENMICAGLLDVGGRDACQGDSGGPLYYGDIVVGVVSWGFGCANETYPGVSTAVAPYTNWIISNVS